MDVEVLFITTCLRLGSAVLRQQTNFQISSAQPADHHFLFVGDWCRSSGSLVWLPSGRWPRGSRPCSSSSCPAVIHTPRQPREGWSSGSHGVLKTFRPEGILAPSPLARACPGVVPLPHKGVGVPGNKEERTALL